MYKWTDWRITIYVTVSKKASLRETQGFFISPYFHAKKGTANAVPLGVGGFCCIPARRSLGWVASASFIERTIRLLHSFISTKKGTANAVPFGGDKGIRTPDLYVANVSRYQLCYIPEFIINFNSVT